VRSGVFAAHLTATTAAGSSASIRQSMGFPRQALSASVDVLVQSEGAAGGNVPLLRFLDPTGARVLSIFRQNGGPGRVYVTIGGVTYQSTGTIATDHWTTVAVRIEVNGSASMLSIAIDGQPALAMADLSLETPGLLTILLGNDTRRQALDLYLDNVTIQTP